MKNRLRLAMSTEIYNDLPLSDRFREIAAFGVRNVVLCIEDELAAEQIEAAYSDFSKLGLRCAQVTSLNMPMSYLDEEHYAEAIKEVNKLCDALKIYGGNQMVLSPGSYSDNRQEHFDAAVKYIAEACDIAAKNEMYCALELTGEDNSLVKTWDEISELYEKVGKDNLLLNVNTAYLHQTSASDENIEFLDEKSAILELQDIKDDDWDTDINIGEGISDIPFWLDRTHGFVYHTCIDAGSVPCALMAFKNHDEMEINRTLRYLEKALPELRL